VTGATRDMSQCLARSFSCRHCGQEIDNGTVQMTFLACIPAAHGQSHTAEVLFRSDSVRFYRRGHLRSSLQPSSLPFCGSVREFSVCALTGPADSERWISSRSPGIIPLEESPIQSLWRDFTGELSIGKFSVLKRRTRITEARRESCKVEMQASLLPARLLLDQVLLRNGMRVCVTFA